MHKNPVLSETPSCIHKSLPGPCFIITPSWCCTEQGSREKRTQLMSLWLNRKVESLLEQLWSGVLITPANCKPEMRAGWDPLPISEPRAAVAGISKVEKLIVFALTVSSPEPWISYMYCKHPLTLIVCVWDGGLLFKTPEEVGNPFFSYDAQWLLHWYCWCFQIYFEMPTHFILF